jgi:hypothetical protein
MAETEQLRTRLGRTWKLKILIFAIGLLALGVWGAYDAYAAYPARGRLHAQFMLRDYLRVADAQLRIARASVEDPAAELRRLRDADTLTELDERRRDWLVSLSRLGSLAAISRENERELARRDAEPTAERRATPTLFLSPRGLLDELESALQTANQPKPLAGYDIPLQYAFMIGGLLGGAWLVALFVRVKARVFRYEPGAQRLILPGGQAVTPDQIEVVDKRKWDKFLVFLTLRDQPGELKLDLYRHDPLERWVLEMERLAPGYEPETKPGEASLAVDGETGRLVSLRVGDERPFPVEGRYHAVSEVIAGGYRVVGEASRRALSDDAGPVPLRAGGAFELEVGEVDPDALETVEIGARAVEESAGPAPE